MFQENHQPDDIRTSDRSDHGDEWFIQENSHDISDNGDQYSDYI